MEHSELLIALRRAGAPRTTAFAGYNAHSGGGCQDVALALLVHLPHDRPPQALFAANELSGLFGRQVARVGAEHLKPLDHLGHGDDLAEVCIDLLSGVPAGAISTIHPLDTTPGTVSSMVGRF